MVYCRCVAPTLFPLWGNNREDNIFPYERTEITPAVIRWHSLRRVVRRAAHRNICIGKLIATARRFPGLDLWFTGPKFPLYRVLRYISSTAPKAGCFLPLGTKPWAS